ncbi:MAG: ankyrin repeat domain-containing protein [Thermoanaerobaculia bacterium]
MIEITSLFELLVGKGSVAALIGILVCAAISRSTRSNLSTASTRHLVWTATLAGLLLLPVVAVVAPPVPLAVLPAAQIQAAPPVAALSEAGDDGTAVTTVPGASVQNALSKASRKVRQDPLSVALLIYLAGVIGSFIYFLGGLVGVWRLTRTAEPSSETREWKPLLAGLSARRRGAPEPVLLTSPALPAPATWGFFRPKVLLPAQASRWTAQERRHALVHELAHIERRDWASRLLAHLVCTIYWFHPLVWLVARQHTLEAERACDDRVLAAGVGSSDYASQLVGIARGVQVGSSWRLTALSMARRGHLQRRIRSLLDPRRRRTPMSASMQRVVFVLACLPAITMSPVQLVTAATPLAGNRAGISEDVPDTTLIRAAIRGDAPAVERAVRAGADVNAPVKGFGTPLIQAAASGKLEIVDFLIESRADVNQVATRAYRPDGLMRTPLTTAARAGHVEIVRVLLDAGANVGLAPNGDATALIAASGAGHTAIAELLLERGADVNRAMSGDGTALIAAARSGSLETVALLLAAGADPDTYVDGDENALYHAAKSGNQAIIEALVAAGADVDVELPGDGNALIVAAGRGNEKAVRALLNAGAEVDSAVEGDGNAMIQAASSGNLPLLRLLLERGADVNAAVRGDGNPLIAAARAGHLDAVHLLLENGAAIDRVVRGDENPLIQAAGAGHLEVVSYLIERGADVNASVLANGREIRTPLLQATRGGHEEVVELLVAAGARD